VAVVGNFPQLHQILFCGVPQEVLHLFLGADPRWSCWSWVCLAGKSWSGVVFLSEAVWSSPKHALIIHPSHPPLYNRTKHFLTKCKTFHYSPVTSSPNSIKNTSVNFSLCTCYILTTFHETKHNKPNCLMHFFSVHSALLKMPLWSQS
jgi:hypothetical protein